MVATRYFIPIMVFVVGIGPSFSAERQARSRMVMEPHLLYEAAFNDIERNDWEKLRKAIRLLEPLLGETDPERLISLEESIDQRDPQRTKVLLIESIALGIIFSLKNEPVGDRAKVVVQQSFSEYLTIDPMIRQVDLSMATLLISEFKKFHSLCHTQSPERNAVLADIERHVQRSLVLLKGFSQ